MEYRGQNNPQNINPQPGPCPRDHVTGEPICPPPTEMVCIKTQKVYESCVASLTNEEVADLRVCNVNVVGEIREAVCKDPILLDEPDFPIVCEKLPGTNRARVRFFYIYRFAFLDDENWKQFQSDPVFVEKTVIFSDRIMDPRIFVQCEIFLECTEVIITDPQVVTVCIGKGLVFKLFADVQLLIPAYGFCPEPPECVQPPLVPCPEFVFDWDAKYPPQDEPPNNDNNNNNNNC